jgi:hypothetical protein
LLAQCDLYLLEDDADEKKKQVLLNAIKESTDFIYSVLTPHIFNDNDINSVTNKLDESYESLFFILENEIGSFNVYSLTVFSFYKRLEIIETRAKETLKQQQKHKHG